MEILASTYFTIWAVTGVLSLCLGMEALDRTDLPNSIPPLVMSLFKHSFAISVCHSCTYSLIFRPKLRTSVGKYYTWAAFTLYPILLTRVSGFAWHFLTSLVNFFIFFLYFLADMQRFVPKNELGILNFWSLVIALFPPLYFLFRGQSLGFLAILLSNFLIFLQIPFAVDSEEQHGILVHFCGIFSVFIISKTLIFPSTVVIVASLTSAAWAEICNGSSFISAAWAAVGGDERLPIFMPAAVARENQILTNLKKMIMKNYGKVIEFAIGMAGTILFQNFFRLTSFDHVEAFLYLAVAWLANLALLLARYDFGIFSFFLSNVIVGCTVSQSGLRGTTWLAYGAAILLYILRLGVEALVLENRERDGTAIIVWQC